MTMTPRLVARSPEDVLAMVPVLLGFHPDDSLVMITLGARHAFHARVDVPAARADVPEWVTTLVTPVRREGVEAVVLVLYSRETPTARRAVHDLVDALRDAGVTVKAALRVEGRRYFPLLQGRRRGQAGVPFDISTHPFLADAVLRGEVTLDSRAALAQTLTPDPRAVGAVRVALTEAVAARTGGDSEAAWVVDTVHAGLAGAALDSPRLARLLVGVAEAEVREEVWATLVRSTARAHVALWTRVLRAAPPGLAAAPALVLGFAAWLDGRGALSWCALDRAMAEDPDEPLGSALAELLMRAVPPHAWDDGLARLLVRGTG